MDPAAILVVVCVILIWRAVSGLADIYIIPNDRVLSYVVTTLFAFVTLSYLEQERQLVNLSNKDNLIFT